MFAYLDGDFRNKAVTYTGRQIERSQECGHPPQYHEGSSKVRVWRSADAFVSTNRGNPQLLAD